MDRPGQTKGADIGSLGQQVVGDEKKELSENFEDVYTCRGMVSHDRNCRTILVSEYDFVSSEEMF
jgi:hypothetical protein